MTEYYMTPGTSYDVIREHEKLHMEICLIKIFMMYVKYSKQGTFVKHLPRRLNFSEVVQILLRLLSHSKEVQLMNLKLFND